MARLSKDVGFRLRFGKSFTSIKPLNPTYEIYMRPEDLTDENDQLIRITLLLVYLNITLVVRFGATGILCRGYAHCVRQNL